MSQAATVHFRGQRNDLRTLPCRFLSACAEHSSDRPLRWALALAASLGAVIATKPPKLISAKAAMVVHWTLPELQRKPRHPTRRRGFASLPQPVAKPRVPADKKVRVARKSLR